MSPFTTEEVTRCKDAMSKPAPREALALIASGRVVIEFSRDGRNVMLESLDGRPIRDPEDRNKKMGFAGAWPLRRAGMIDEYGCVTDAGHALLAGAPQ